jgi:hypothetical protein
MNLTVLLERARTYLIKAALFLGRLLKLVAKEEEKK